jgi:tripartite-type tricarboxylate transporter receptor subunit TctC
MSYAKPFYQGKVSKIIVTTKPGGGYDYYARLIARFMQKYLPGSTFIVKNIPGAGNVIGTNAIYAAKPDGLTFGTFNRGVGMTQVAAVKGLRFDLTKMSWLGSPTSEVTGYIVHKSFKNLDDVLKAENMRVATGGLGTTTYITVLLFYKMLGQDNYSFGTGYAGGEVELAIMRREMDGNFGSFDSRKVMVKQGFGRFVMFIGKTKPAGYESVPFIEDVIKDKKYKPVIDLLKGINMVGRPFAGPPGIPIDRLKTLRSAFRKAIHDPELLEHAKKASRPIAFVSPEECEAWAKSLFELPPDVTESIKRAFEVK